MEDEIQRIQKVLVRQFRQYGRLYLRTREILTVDGIETLGERKIPSHRMAVIEDPDFSPENFKALFALQEPYRARVSLLGRQRYSVLGEGEISERERTRVREVENYLKMRVYPKNKDDREPPEICPHELRPFEDHLIVIGHKSGIYSGTVALRSWGAGIYIQIETEGEHKIFGVGNFIGGTVYIHGVLYRLTERKARIKQ